MPRGTHTFIFGARCLDWGGAHGDEGNKDSQDFFKKAESSCAHSTLAQFVRCFQYRTVILDIKLFHALFVPRLPQHVLNSSGVEAAAACRLGNIGKIDQRVVPY